MNHLECERLRVREFRYLGSILSLSNEIELEVSYRGREGVKTTRSSDFL